MERRFTFETFFISPENAVKRFFIYCNMSGYRSLSLIPATWSWKSTLRSQISWRRRIQVLLLAGIYFYPCRIQVQVCVKNSIVCKMFRASWQGYLFTLFTHPYFHLHTACLCVNSREREPVHPKVSVLTAGDEPQWCFFYLLLLLSFCLTLETSSSFCVKCVKMQERSEKKSKFFRLFAEL